MMECTDTLEVLYIALTFFAISAGLSMLRIAFFEWR